MPDSSPKPNPFDDHQTLAFLDFIRKMTREERVGVVKSYRPAWTVRQIADACGVSERTVIRSVSYRRLREIDQARQAGQSRWRGRKRRRIEPPPDDSSDDPVE